LKFPYESMYGCTYEDVREHTAHGRLEDLLKLIMEKYQRLQSECGVVLCAGTDFSGVVAPLEFEVNIEIANNLGCFLILVINGQGRESGEIIDGARLHLENLDEKNSDVLALVVNRVDPGRLEAVKQSLRGVLGEKVLTYAIPEHPVLAHPTVGEIARDLNAQLIRGGPESSHREVMHYKVAAMELPHFLDHVEEGSLIITPGDRSDIVLGSLVADASQSYPQIAGLVLTGNFRPAPQVQRLIDGLTQSPVPIYSVATDTFTTAMRVNSLQGAILPESTRKIAAGLGAVESNVDFEELERRFEVALSVRITPLMFEQKLIQQARAERKHIVLPEGAEERILRAAEILLLRGVVDITLLGDPNEIHQVTNRLGLSVEQANVISPWNSAHRETFAETHFQLRKHRGISQQISHDAMADPTYFGTMMVYHGMADGLVSGAVHTTQDTLRPALEIIRTRPGILLASSVFFMCMGDRVLVFGDCAVNPDPNAEQLAHIAISSAETARRFGIDPLVAMLSYSTGESGKGKDVDKVREATGIARGLRPDLEIEGPIQYDAAVDATVARLKMPESKVAGRATVFVFPDLNNGNITYKAVQRSANAVAIGPVMQGLNKPVNDLSRGALVTDIVNTIAITAIQAQTEGVAP
ncbi:MAG: phosphate acetyltransferase, partial [Syntrophobacteraceae bacterium]|nr:phosphate acetyltransferase [Syntrophobacteraceae bacterium]